MKTNRFETFFDAILAIIITVLVLKLGEPAAPTLSGLFLLKTIFLSYLVCFLVIFFIWYDNHNLFQVIDGINNAVLVIYAAEIFAISLLPYFSTWVALHINSIAAETMFGLDFIALSVLYLLSIFGIYRANPYTCGLSIKNFKNPLTYVPLTINILGFIISYTIYTPGIYISVLVSVLFWLLFSRLQSPDNGSTDRFEAFIDAIIAIIITIIVLEIPMVSNGSWDSFLSIKLEFIVYAVSFIVCFNFWNYNNNLFQIVNKVNHKVVWSIGASLFILSLIPFLTTFVALNPDSFLPSFLYGLDFILVAALSIRTAVALKDSDKANIALQVALPDNKPYMITIIFAVIGMILGYFVHPLLIVVACLVSIFFTWVFTYLSN